MPSATFAPLAFCPPHAAAARSQREENANTVTHALGAVLSVGALIGLLRVVAPQGNFALTLAATVFGLSLCLLYSASALYHGLTNRRWKHRFLQLDYAGIFLLIAGTYTPFVLVHLRTPLGLAMLAAVWLLCGCGAALAVFHRFPWRSRAASTSFYLVLGWLALLIIPPMARAMPVESLQLLLAGGGCYTAGTIFFAWDRLPYHHAVWHVFVLAGSACHWVAIYGSFTPAGA
ncbi:MAG: hemolysin III family protein [Candidatus Didemnitutus sp.]|nr:hemolysin III family protein [Candidatus Didemnitutus sp.]